MVGGFKFRMDENSSDGVSIAGLKNDAVSARLCIHFHETDKGRMPDEEIAYLANRDGEAAVNEESKEYFADILRIETLYIAADSRDKGVGTFLIQKAKNYADLRKFPLVVSVFPLARGLAGKPYKKSSATPQEIRRLFWFFKKNGFKNRAIEFAMKRHMKLPEWFYKEPRDFYYIPELLRKKAK